MTLRVGRYSTAVLCCLASLCSCTRTERSEPAKAELKDAKPRTVEEVNIPRATGPNAPDVQAFKYSGTWIDCILEVEIDGKWVVLQELQAQQLKTFGQSLSGPIGENDEAIWNSLEPEGHVVLARRSPENPDAITIDVMLAASGKDGRSACISVSDIPFLALSGPGIGPRTVGSSFSGGNYVPTKLDKEVNMFSGTFTLQRGEDKAERKLRLTGRPAALAEPKVKP